MAGSARSGPGTARVLVLAAAVCFATTGTAQALGPDDVSPVQVGAARVVLGGALLAAWAALVRSRRSAAPVGAGVTSSRRGVRPGPVVVGALGVAAYQPAFFAGVALSGVAVGTLVALGSAPVMTGLAEWALTRRPPGARWGVATGLAALGVVVLGLGGGGAAGSLDPLGVAASLGAGASYAVYTLASKRLLLDGHGPDAVMGMLFGVAAVLLTPVLLVAGPGWLLTAAGAATAAFLALVPTALAYVLFVRGLRALPAADVATLTLAEPVTAAALGVLLLAEPFGVATAVGSGVLVAGLVVLATGVRRPAPAPAPAAPGPHGE